MDERPAFGKKERLVERMKYSTAEQGREQHQAAGRESIWRMNCKKGRSGKKDMGLDIPTYCIAKLHFREACGT